MRNNRFSTSIDDTLDCFFDRKTGLNSLRDIDREQVPVCG